MLEAASFGAKLAAESDPDPFSLLRGVALLRAEPLVILRPSILLQKEPKMDIDFLALWL